MDPARRAGGGAAAATHGDGVRTGAAMHLHHLTYFAGPASVLLLAPAVAQVGAGEAAAPHSGWDVLFYLAGAVLSANGVKVIVDLYRQLVSIRSESASGKLERSMADRAADRESFEARLARDRESHGQEVRSFGARLASKQCEVDNLNRFTEILTDKLAAALEHFGASSLATAENTREALSKIPRAPAPAVPCEETED